MFLGSAITFLISYLNNRFEAKERDKDREEARREAKIQAREKWIERDVLRAMEIIDKMLILLSDYHSVEGKSRSLSKAREFQLFTEEEFRTDMKSLFNKIRQIMLEADYLATDIEKLVFSFKDEKIPLVYEDFAKATNAVTKKLNDAFEASILEKKTVQYDITEEWEVLTETAGEVHRALREKLISLRDI